MNKETIVRKLTSRKLWMALAAFISGVVTVIWGDKTAQIVGGLVLQFAAVVAYIVGEGLVDAAASKPPNGDAGREDASNMIKTEEEMKNND